MIRQAPRAKDLEYRKVLFGASGWLGQVNKTEGLAPREPTRDRTILAEIICLCPVTHIIVITLVTTPEFGNLL